MTPIESAKVMSGVWSQKGDTSLGDKILLVDATDGITNGGIIPESASGEGVLLLADGSRFLGRLFGFQRLGSRRISIHNWDDWLPRIINRSFFRRTGLDIYISIDWQLWNTCWYE